MAKFKTRARAVDMLGRQQIAGIPTAISELFKNAHDAYAQHADVDYFRADDIFVLRDDGIGMTEDDFLNRWLAIGTESKIGASVGLAPPPKPEEEKARPMLGEKGIGRLAIAAIGPQVLILTRAIRGDKQYDTVAAFVNWGIFETPGLNLDEIEIPVIPYDKGALPTREDIKALVDLFRENTKLLQVLKQTELAERIHNELEQFILDPQALDSFLKTVSTPTLTGSGKGTHFLILPTNESLVLDIDGDENPDDEAAPPIVQRLIGFTNTMTDEVKPHIVASFRVHKPLESFTDLISPSAFFTPEEFKTADHHFHGEFDEFGQFTGTVTIYNKPPISHTIQWTEGKGARAKCGKFVLNLAYVQGQSHESLLPADQWFLITEKLKKIGGLYIYKNGIRVLPYGSSDYDFLDLERKRTKKASTAYFSYRRMFGYVEITAGDNPELSEKAGREGFRENAAYKEFKAILKNFFRQMAADFFQESGIYSDAYVEVRGELQRLNQVRRAREQRVREKRKEFADHMDRFFDALETRTPAKESVELVDAVSTQIDEILKSQDPLQISSALMDIEADARQKLEVLRGRFKVEKPAGLGLTPSLRRDWELHKNEARRLEDEIFQPAQKSVETLVTEAALQQPSNTGPKERIKIALNNRIAEAQKSIDDAKHKIQREIENVNNRLDEVINRSSVDVTETIRKARTELERVVGSNRDDGFVLGEYYRLEAAIRETTEREQIHLDIVGKKLQQAVDLSVNADEIIEALEEENLALAERAEADVELAQLGMAVSVIGHEFRSTVNSMRNNLNRLKGWAEVNKDLRELWRNIRSDFDHLDAYLQLFTPLQQRLFRKKVTITGVAIETYLRNLFEERFKRENVVLHVSNAFKRMSFAGYPSTFYPVFVNLIDNSLYWLKDRSGEKLIQLEMEGGSTLIVSDNGPGVPKRDREAIFELGFTRKPGGRGMGLKISRDVLAREEWELILGDASSSGGASFKIRPLPQKKRG
ncbi:MAG TPA: ATP-binding protein [Pyrinomonadaceae bacterium]|nr:ATP-binding protein [Pyrinomonadaceae bacterium]